MLSAAFALSVGMVAARALKAMKLKSESGMRLSSEDSAYPTATDYLPRNSPS